MPIIAPTGPEDTFAARLAQIPAPFRPEGQFRRYRTLDELVRVLKAPPFELPAPETIDLVAEHGLAACEGALFKTLADMAGRRRPIKEPRALMIWALRRGKGWTEQQIDVYLNGLLEDALQRLQSGNPTEQRLARDLEEAWGEAPENVTAFPAARAQ
jgi:hypothetical protein